MSDFHHILHSTVVNTSLKKNKKMEKRKVLGQCQICGADRAYTQYGAIACRACGTFFRRVSLLRRTYTCTCRHAEGMPPMCGTERILRCKGCRQQKCMAMGMTDQRLRSLSLNDFHRQRQLFFLATTKAEAEEGNNINSTTQENEEILTSGTMQPQYGLTCCDTANSALLAELLAMEALVQRIRNSPTPVPDEFFQRNGQLEMFVANSQEKSLLCQTQKFSSEPMPNWDKAGKLDAIYRFGTFSQRLLEAEKDLALCVEIARALPAFGRIDTGDRAALLKSSALSANILFMFYASAQQKSDTLLMADGGQMVPVWTTIGQRYQWNPIFLRASERMFTQPMVDFLRIDLSREEFVLLFTMLLLNSSTSSLSSHGQRVLKAEEERLGQVLLRWQQRRYGAAAGALRYMQSLQLHCAAVNIARWVRQMFVYIDSVYEQGQLERVMPRLLVPLMT